MKKNGEKRISNVLLISFFSMLTPMILATGVFGSSSYLAVLYMIGYAILLFSFFMLFVTSNMKISMNSMVIFLLYAVILTLPVINDVVKGISIDYYDPLNAVIKALNFFIFYVLLRNMRIGREGLYRFARGLVLFSVLVCLFSVVFEFKEILSIRTTTNTNVLKISSIFSNRNQYSAFLVIALISNLYAYMLKPKKSNILIMGLQLLCILTTFSRAALFSSIIILGLMFLQMKNVQKKTMIIVMGGIIGLGVLVTTGALDYFLKNYVRLEQSGDSGRFNLWRYAWDVAKENLFTGVGFYTGVDIARARGMKLTQFHNMFFDLLVNGGIPEVTFIIGLLFTTYRRCVKHCCDNKVVAVYRAAFVAFVFYAFFESISVLALSYGDTMYSIFFISLPLLMANLEQDDGKNEMIESKA